jgi:hypothetical protein
MDANLKKILDELPCKPPCSRLEPYREFIEELRGRGRTYREIAEILADKCAVEVTGSGVHDYLMDKSVPPYRHPHSFYFSGYPLDPPNAPIISQNYTEFAMIRPDPAETWDLAAKYSAGHPILPACNLFGSKKTEVPSWARDSH